jgi:hypothetical protein
MKAVGPIVQPDFDPDDLIPIAVAARMLGHKTTDAIRKRLAGTEGLTIIAQGSGERPRLYLILGEVLAHRQNLIDNARRRTDVLRLVKKAQ